MRVSPAVVVCTKPDCNTSIEVTETVLSKNDNLPQRDVSCSCEFLICLKCGMPGHSPIDCTVSHDWNSQIDARKDKLSTYWINSNTKKCPSCK